MSRFSLPVIPFLYFLAFVPLYQWLLTLCTWILKKKKPSLDLRLNPCLLFGNFIKGF